MIIKLSKDFETEENIVEQAKNSIKKLDKRITEVQNPSSRLFNVFYTTFATTTRSIAATIQAPTL